MFSYEAFPKLETAQKPAMANFPKGISPADYVPPPNRPYIPPWNSKDACRVICDCGGSYDTDVSSTLGRIMTFNRNDRVDPKVRHERGQRHQKWAKSKSGKIRQDSAVFCCVCYVFSLIEILMALQPRHSQRSQEGVLSVRWRLFEWELDLEIR